MGVSNDAPLTPVAATPQQIEGEYNVVLGKTASELTALFNEQSALIKLNPEHRFERNVHYGLVECDVELSRMPLDAKSLGLAVQASEFGNDELSENFVMSLLLATGTLSHCTIDVPFDSKVEPDAVLQEAEAQGLNVRLLLPPDVQDQQQIESYTNQLAIYSEKWLGRATGNHSLSPLDGYLEYKFVVAMGHTPKTITLNSEMHVLFTDNVPESVMDFIKARLDKVIDECLGGDEYFVETSKKVGAALYLKEVELRQARVKMLEEELDARTPVPNLIRLTSQMTGLRLADAAGLIYELKNSIHTVLDKYLPYAEGEVVVENKPPKAQYELAQAIVGALSGGFGGTEALLAAWEDLTAKSQLNKVIDLDRGTAQPSSFAVRMAASAGVSEKIAALALAESAGMLGSILKAGSLIDEVTLHRPEPVPSVHAAPASNIIAKG